MECEKRVLILVTFGLSAQSNIEGETFLLTKQGGHYVFNASINGTADATILVESGIPALLVDSAYAFSGAILSDMELTVANKEKLNLGGRVYKITHKANGTVRIGNSTSYVGEVFVPLFTATGNIGLKFFEKIRAIFDFDQSVVYMKGK